MSYFNYQHDDLFCESKKLIDLVREIPTPFYVYSQNGLMTNFDKIDTAFSGVPHTICFALKANSNLALLRLLAKRGCGADVVSGGELYLALKAGFPPEKIVFAGVGKRDDEIKYAIETGIAALNVESPQELEVVNQLAAEVGKKVNIALRVNPDVDVHGHPHISTGSAFNKFGIDWEVVPDIYAMALKTKPMLKMMGIHTHIGSMIFNMEYYQATALRLKALVEKLRQLGAPIEHIDIGGGLGINYQQPLAMMVDGVLKPEIPSPEPQGLTAAILPILESLKCDIFFEPGRSIVANTGALVTQVLFAKQTRDKQFFSVDTGMHQLIRPALYGAYHEVVPLKQHPEKFIKADIVGPICESTDVLAKDRTLPVIKRGEYLAIMTAGAYGFSLASNYNGHPLPAEILIDGNHFQIIRKRQSYDDLLLQMA